jgi:hypothetical protein
MRNYQARRPSLLDFEVELKSTQVPTLIIAGDEDDPVLLWRMYGQPES